MAEKTLHTRIINKHADLAAWKDSTLQLKAGEIALAKVLDTSMPDGHGGYYTRPTYMMKIGDGTSTFSELNWLAATASDVYEWAKKTTLQASDMPVLTEAQSKRIDPKAWDAISALQLAVGSGGSVSELINAAIEALDENTWVAEDGYKVVTAIGETNGKISVTRRQLGIADIDGLQVALNAKLDVTTYNTDKQASDKLISDNTTAINTETEARQKADETLQGNIDKKADQSDLNTTNENVTKAQNAADAAQDAADAAQEDATEALNAIGDNNSGLTKRVVTLETNSATKTELSTAQSTLQGNIDKKADQSALNTTNENVTKAQNAADAAQDAADAAQEDADAALGLIGTGFENATGKTVAEKLSAVSARVDTIAEDYLKESDTFIIDCGGAE